jgi:hypothetical protein
MKRPRYSKNNRERCPTSLIAVKNCDWFEILPYLHSNKLAPHCFMVVDKRHKNFGSETRLYYP